MAYAKTTWKDRLVQRPRTYIETTNSDGSITHVPSEGVITEAGTPVNALNLNKLENGLEAVSAAADTLRTDVDGHTSELAEVTAQLADTQNLQGWELQNKTRKVRPLASFVSDDGNKKDYDNLRPIAVSKGVPFVSAVVTNAIGNSTQMTAAQLQTLQALGWEISSHTHSHQNLTTLTYQQIDDELRVSKETLQSLSIKCTTMCIPYGFYNDSVLELSRKYFRCSRSSDGGINRSPLETFKLRSVLFAEDTATDGATGLVRNSLEWYKYNVDQAVATNGWIVFLMHSNNVDSTQLGYLSSLIDYIASLNVEVVTLDGGYDRFGNIVDVGLYDRTNTTKYHYVIGADGTVSSTRNNKDIVITNTDEYLNPKLPSDFAKGHIYITKVSTSNATGFPGNKAGTLITDRIQTDGWAYQEYHVYGSTDVYKRYEVNETTWSTWTQINASLTTGAMQYRGTDTYLFSNIPTDFPVGCITANTITTGSATGMPEGKAGRLFTDRLISDTTWMYQTYHPISSNTIYKRYATSASAWSAFVKVSAV